MPVYHSKIKNSDVSKIMGFPLLFVRKDSPPMLETDNFISSDDQKYDILDEAIAYYRINILFKNFSIDSDADKVLVYLTVFIQKILEIAGKYFDDEKRALKEIDNLEASGKGNVKEISSKNVLSLLLNDERNAINIEKLNTYLKGLRKEAIFRMKYILFENSDFRMDKRFWTSMGKKKFLGYEFI